MISMSRKYNLPFLTCLLILVVTGCSGGGGASSSPPALISEENIVVQELQELPDSPQTDLLKKTVMLKKSICWEGRSSLREEKRQPLRRTVIKSCGAI